MSSRSRLGLRVDEVRKHAVVANKQLKRAERLSKEKISAKAFAKDLASLNAAELLEAQRELQRTEAEKKLSKQKANERAKVREEKIATQIAVEAPEQLLSLVIKRFDILDSMGACDEAEKKQAILHLEQYAQACRKFATEGLKGESAQMELLKFRADQERRRNKALRAANRCEAELDQHYYTYGFNGETPGPSSSSSQRDSQAQRSVHVSGDLGRSTGMDDVAPDGVEDSEILDGGSPVLE